MMIVILIGSDIFFIDCNEVNVLNDFFVGVKVGIVVGVVIVVGILIGVVIWYWYCRYKGCI